MVLHTIRHFYNVDMLDGTKKFCVSDSDDYASLRKHQC